MRFIRFGPTLVFLRSSEHRKSRKFLNNLFGVENISVDKAMNKSGQFDTIAFLTSSKDRKTVLSTEDTYLIRKPSNEVMKELFNYSKNPIDRVDIGPLIVLLRIPSNADEAIKVLEDRYGGKKYGLEESINLGEENDTLVLVTDEKLSSFIKKEDSQPVLIPKSFMNLYRKLEIDLPIIFYKVLPEEWREVSIKIYDVTLRYEKNIERLLTVLEDLELGMIVNEGWTWDRPMFMLKVRTYQIKLITWEAPERIKFLLNGLEYKDNVRLSDIDVFKNGKKIEWKSVAKEYDSKEQLTKAARKELEKELSDEALENLNKIEEELISKKVKDEEKI